MSQVDTLPRTLPEWTIFLGKHALNMQVRHPPTTLFQSNEARERKLGRPKEVSAACLGPNGFARFRKFGHSKWHSVRASLSVDMFFKPKVSRAILG